jgi:hypothetical protein
MIALMMEAVRTSEMTVNFNMTTWLYSPEDSKLHTRHDENLTSHLIKICLEVLRFRTDGQTDVVKQMDAFLQVVVVNMVKNCCEG